MNRSVQVHVIESILIVPDSRRRIGDLVTQKAEAIIARVCLEAVDRCARPSPDGSQHSHCVTDWRKAETGRPADAILAM